MSDYTALNLVSHIRVSKTILNPSNQLKTGPNQLTGYKSITNVYRKSKKKIAI